MEPHRFDAFSQTLARGLTRRALGILVGTLTAIPVRDLPARNKQKKKCAAGLSPCKIKKGKKKKRLCADLQTDPAHCGGCGQVCPGGQTCTRGACGSPPPAARCTATSCPSGCCDDRDVCQAGGSDAACGTGGASCRACTLPETCGGGGQPRVCGCTRATCQRLGKTCGSWPDGCGRTLACGICENGATPTCNDGRCATCAATCPTPTSGVCNCLTLVDGSNICIGGGGVTCDVPCETDDDCPANQRCARAIILRSNSQPQFPCGDAINFCGEFSPCTVA